MFVLDCAILLGNARQYKSEGKQRSRPKNVQNIDHINGGSTLEQAVTSAIQMMYQKTEFQTYFNNFHIDIKDCVTFRQCAVSIYCIIGIGIGTG